MRSKLARSHLERRACVYVRQSTAMQVHEHVESTKRQYALVERAAALGWSRADVDVIDEDQGKSGSTADARAGFTRLAEAVGHGEIGAILAVEVSRLARSSMDWQRLLSLCAVTGVVVIDEQGIYDPGDHDDRMLLDLKGTMSEAELHWLRLRLAGGRLNKARRGELQLTPPIGYVWRDTRFVFDPDEAVQRAVRLVFERFAIEPSVWAVVRWAHANGIRFPARTGPIDGSGEVEWRAMRMGRISSMLRNPIYAGVYAYGRREKHKVVVDGEIRTRTKRLAADEWAVRIVDAHEAYIDEATYVSNQERLRKNQARMHGAVGGAAPKKGRALLASMILCARCSSRMRVDYTTHERVSWRYICVGKNQTGQNICWSVNGAEIDDTIEQLFLAAMVPEEIDLTIAVEKEADGQARSLEAQWQARLEQARYETRRAERRYKAVDPENRIVARTLERDWEARLQDLDEVERQYAEARRERRVDLSTTDRTVIREIAKDLPAVWRANTTTAAERKAMLRLVIEMISLEPIDLPSRSTRVRVQWCSGVVDEKIIERPVWVRALRPPPTLLLDRLQSMLDEGLANEDIAQHFNAEGFRTAKRQAWTASAVAHARTNYKLRRATKPTKTFLPDRHPTTGYYSIPGAARRFGVSRDVVKSWVRRRLVQVHKARFGRYDARWLDIDEARADELARLGQHE
ncbi:MAG: recombinase family protein [Hyphomicrobiaceae bacterium]